MKRVIASVLAGAMLIVTAWLANGNGSEAAVKGKLNEKSATVAIGKSVQLKVKNKGKAKVRWSSSRKKIAKVSSRGKVTGRKKGKESLLW